MTNKVTAIGNLTADPTTGSTNTNRNFTNFTLAVTTNTKDQAGKYVSMFYRVSAFGKMGELCANYLSKGSKVLVIGDFSTREYKDTAGKDRIAYQINVDTVEFLTPKNTQQAAPQDSPQEEEMDPNEPPF